MLRDAPPVRRPRAPRPAILGARSEPARTASPELDTSTRPVAVPVPPSPVARVSLAEPPRDDRPLPWQRALALGERRTSPTATLALLLAALLALACRPAATVPPAIALGERGEHLYLATGGELRVFDVSARRGPERPRPLPAPCAPLVDLELYGPLLHALCGDGRIFARFASDFGEPPDPAGGTWRAVAPRPAATGARAPLIAFQRSDHALLGVHADGTISVIAPPDRTPPEHPLDRFRGPDRGGPGEPPIATFAAFAPDFAHAFARRRAAELTGSLEGHGFTCRIPGRRAWIRDLALSRTSIAAVHLDRRGRARVVLAHPRAPWRSPLAGAHDPVTGRRSAPWIRCWPP